MFVALSERACRELQRWHNPLTETIDAQSVANHMINSQELADRDLDAIRSRRDEPARAASQLVRAVRKRPRELYCAFARALDETGHHHVRELIHTGDIQGMSYMRHSEHVA